MSTPNDKSGVKPGGVRLVPGVCDVSVTNVCNARCSFCSYAYDKQLITEKRWIDLAEFGRALPILHRRGIRYLNFQGGEPLLHPYIQELVAETHAAGIRPAVITNGWLLPQKIQGLIDARLSTLLVSIDSHSLADHEHNRGLDGVCERVRAGLAVARSYRIPALASVTVSRLVNYDLLAEFLRTLGFDAVTFSYPRVAPLGSSSMVFSPNSRLIQFETEELVQALEQIKSLKKRFPVLNPTHGIEDIQRHIRKQPEEFGCIGGHKYFYLDWNLNIWRCEAWSRPLGSVFDLDRIPDCRDRCTACMMSCYRDTSVLMHAGVAVEDAIGVLIHGHPVRAARLLFLRTVASSVGAVLGQMRQIFNLARPRRLSGKRVRPTARGDESPTHGQSIDLQSLSQSR